jgi:hypothetical protein
MGARELSRRSCDGSDIAGIYLIVSGAGDLGQRFGGWGRGWGAMEFFRDLTKNLGRSQVPLGGAATLRVVESPCLEMSGDVRDFVICPGTPWGRGSIVRVIGFWN